MFNVTHIRTGGIGVIGGLTYSPKMIRESIDDLRSQLEDKVAPFGVDLAIPQIGGGARKTNVRPSSSSLPARCATYSTLLVNQYDYTKGHLFELTDIIIEKKAALFVCAVGVPPKDMVDKLHTAGIFVMKCV